MSGRIAELCAEWKRRLRAHKYSGPATVGDSWDALADFSVDYGPEIIAALESRLSPQASDREAEPGAMGQSPASPEETEA